MRVSCHQENLAKGLSIVSRAVSSRTTMPVLSNILLEAKNNELRLAATNREISALIEERDRLEFSNEQLRVEIASLKTIPRLLERAQQLGFRYADPAEVQYMVIDGYNPNRDETVVELDHTIAQAVPQYEETFGGWLQQQIDSLSRQFDSFGR